MQALLLRILLFAGCNLVLIWQEITLFQSPYPVLGIVTGVLHVLILCKLPYDRLFS
jgi:hypothetical protein